MNSILEGKISLETDEAKLLSLCADLFPTFDAQRFEVLAVRLYFGKENILTLYASDKGKQGAEKQPVKKFKKEIDDLAVLAPFINAWNFTAVRSGCTLEDMEVINR